MRLLRSAGVAAVALSVAARISHTDAVGVSFDMLPLAALEQLVTRPVLGYPLAESLGRQSRDLLNALRVSTSQSVITRSRPAVLSRALDVHGSRRQMS